MSDLSAPAARRWLCALVLLPLGLRAAFAASVELAPDEAYYAAWARSPDWAYLDHGPLVAWLIAASTALCGEREIAVRLPALLSAAALTWLLYRTARALGATRRSSLCATATATATLGASAGATLMTPDAPLALAWGAAVHLLVRGRTAGSGAAIAAAFTAKLTAGLLWAWSIVAPSGQARRGRVVAAAVGLAGLLPVVAWNAAHGWPTFAFHGERALSRGGLSLETLGEFLAGQVGLLCLLPALLVGAVWVAGLRTGAGRSLRLAAVLSAGPVACVAALSLFTKVEANWIAPAYYAAFAGLAPWMDAARGRRRLVGAAAAFAAAVTLAAHAHARWPYLPLPEQRDPSAQLHGWRDLAAAVRGANDGLPVLASRYQEASELAFYLPDATVSTLPGGARPSQFDLWPRPAPGPALCVWRAGEGSDAGAHVRIRGRDYRIARCDPARWRLPVPGSDASGRSGRGPLSPLRRSG